MTVKYTGEGEESKYVFAPFTEEQQKWLNLFQTAGKFHPFTCHCGEALIVGEQWTCPKCDYTQTWAHAFMAEKSYLHADDQEA